METINLKDLLKVAETGFFITNPEKVDETEIQVKIKNFSVYKRKLLKQLLVKISLMELGLDYESANKSKRNYIKKIIGQKIDESNRKQFDSDVIRQIYLIKSVAVEIRKLKDFKYIYKLKDESVNLKEFKDYSFKEVLLLIAGQFNLVETYNKEKNNSDLINKIKIKELWLPAEHFELDKKSKLKVVKGKEYIKINSFEDGLTHYSFETNRVKFDSDWYSDFLLKLDY